MNNLFLNLLNHIDVLALLVALYSVFYIKKLNRPQLFISSCTFITGDFMPIAWFYVTNSSPIPIILTDITFHHKGVKIEPVLDYEPPTIYEHIGHLSIVNNLYSEELSSSELEVPSVILPYNNLELGYNFNNSYQELTITLHSTSLLTLFKKSKSFTVAFKNKEYDV